MLDFSRSELSFSWPRVSFSIPCLTPLLGRSLPLDNHAATPRKSVRGLMSIVVRVISGSGGQASQPSGEALRSFAEPYCPYSLHVAVAALLFVGCGLFDSPLLVLLLLLFALRHVISCIVSSYSLTATARHAVSDRECCPRSKTRHLCVQRPSHHVRGFGFYCVTASACPDAEHNFFLMANAAHFVITCQALSLDAHCTLVSILTRERNLKSLFRRGASTSLSLN